MYILDLKREKENIKMLVLEKDGWRIIEKPFSFYFYVIPQEGKKEQLRRMLESEGCQVEEMEMSDGWEKRKVLKVYTNKDVEKIKSLIEQIGDPRGHDISPIYLFLIDNELYCLWDYDENFKIRSEKPPKLRAGAFDIEVYNKGRIPDPEKDPIILISYADENEREVFYWTKEKGNEALIIRQFIKKVKEKDLDVIIGYNSAGFDFPYMKKRCKKLGIKLDLGRDGSEVALRRRGNLYRADIFGRVHLDAYDAVDFLTSIGALRLPKNDLESVYKEFFGKEKLDIDVMRLYEYWEEGGEKLEILKEYNIQDAEAAFKVGMETLPLYIELSRILGLPLYDVSHMSPSQMVEYLLVREAYKRGILIPRRPKEAEVRKRMEKQIKGAYVKPPERGLHERIVVCDFRSLYPSIIISHNIDPYTLTDDEEDVYVSPVGHKFSKKKSGLIPEVLKALIEKRVEIKKRMKNLEKDSEEYKILNFRQQALKILANSFYGYLNFARSRWYCRECAEAVTAYGRYYIQKTIELAEKMGFKVIYGDTDSLFIELGDKDVEDAKKFVEYVNRHLPGNMELEFEGYYPRGIFVTKKEGGAAKKRYALIREDGTVEIKGFEFVRRDWADIAKKAQEKVIEAVLKEGKPEKAVDAVRETIKELREGKVDLKDLIIYTQIVKPLEEYEQVGPHVKAAQRLKKAGYPVQPGTIIEYVIVKGRGSISDRAIPVQLLRDEKYDDDYYINNQVLPAALKILRELDIKAEDLITKEKTKQARLGQWF